MRRWPPGVRNAASRPAFTQLMIERGETWQSRAASNVVKTALLVIVFIIIEICSRNIGPSDGLVKLKYRTRAGCAPWQIMYPSIRMVG